MIPVQSHQSQQIAVFGLGTSGLATARALLSGGAYVSAWDDNPAARARSAAREYCVSKSLDY